MNTRKFKTAVVGCGKISFNHLKSLAMLENVEVVALCDAKPEKAEARKTEFNLNSKIYTDFNTMLECEELDTVHIATPHYLHAPMTIAALEKGINVFLEKPICINCEQIKAMLEAEAKSTARVCVSFQNRFNSSFLYAKKLIDEDGGALSGYGTVLWWRSADYYKKSDWRGTYEKEGGGVMINQAIHTIDLLIQFLGKPVKVKATTANHHLNGVIEVEDTCEGIIGFESGTEANFYATNSFKGNDPVTIVIKSQNHKVELRGSDLYVDKQYIERASSTGGIGKECYGNAHPIIIEKFYDAIATGEPMPVTLESAQYALRVLLAAYESQDKDVLI